MKTQPRPQISVIIPTYNRGKVLIDTINDVLNQSFKNLELIVIDQTQVRLSSIEKKINAIKDPRLKYYRAAPPSLTAARNLGLSLCRAPIALFLDDDVRLHPHMIKRHLSVYGSIPKITAVAGRVLQEGFPIKKEVLKFDKYAITHGVFTATQADYTNTFPGGNHSIKVKTALKLGGYDTRYKFNAFREESDLAQRLVKSGYKIYFEPRAALTHLAAPTGGTRNKKYSDLYDNAHFYRNELFFTIRAVKPKDLPESLRRKYNEYCRVRPRTKRIRRSVLFLLGFIGAVLRQAFGRQIKAKLID